MLGAVAFDEGQDWAVPEGLYWDAAHGALSEAALRDGVDEGEKKGLLHAAAFAASRGTKIEPDPDSKIWLPAGRSYEWGLAARRILPGCPLLSMRMGRVEVGNHWSEAKQRRMEDAFVRVMAKLADRGVRRVHLFLAAPNSVVFRLGRHLDRNWPAVQVYQREPGDAVRFPWAHWGRG